MLKLFLLLLAQSTLCLKTSELCTLQESSPNYFNCPKEFPYKCDLNQCSSNRKSCDDFVNFTYLSRLFNIQFHNRLSDAYQIFIFKIKQCKPAHITLDYANVCINGKQCIRKIKLPVREYDFNVINPIKCPCTTAYPYECGSDFCAADSKSCDIYNFSRNLNLNFSIRNCGNDNLVLKLNGLHFKFRY